MKTVNVYIGRAESALLAVPNLAQEDWEGYIPTTVANYKATPQREVQVGDDLEYHLVTACNAGEMTTVRGRVVGVMNAGEHIVFSLAGVEVRQRDPFSKGPMKGTHETRCHLDLRRRSDRRHQYHQATLATFGVTVLETVREEVEALA